MDETRDRSIEFEKYSELRKAKDWSLDDITDLVLISENLPWIGFKTLDRERDLFSFDTDNLDSYFITEFCMFVWIVDMSPINLRNMNESLDSLE